MNKKDLFTLDQIITEMYDPSESGQANKSGGEEIHPNIKKQHDEINEQRKRLKGIASKYPMRDGEQFYEALMDGKISYEDGRQMIVNELRLNSGKDIVEWITETEAPKEGDPSNRGNATDFYY